MNEQVNKRIVRWIVAILYTASIFLLIPFVLPIWNRLCAEFSVPAVVRTVNTAVPALGVLALIAFFAFARETRVRSYLWLAVVAGGFAYLLTLHCEYPVERVHLIQYSLLAFVFYRALRIDLSERASLIIAAAIALLVGTCDEVMQQFVADRRCTLSDMVTNWFAGGLGLVALMAFERDGIWSWYRRRRAAVRFAIGYLAPIAITMWLGGQVWTRYIYPPINVIVLTVDCLRPDRLGVYGYERDTTPVLDEMAKDGAVFTEMFAQAPWTGPGVVSTLSGLYPPVHGVDVAGRTIPAQVTTLIDVFRGRGYSVPDLCYLTVDRTFQQLGAEPIDTDINVAETGEEDALHEWINRHHREPFCIWYHYRKAHLPYNPPQEYRIFPPADDPDAVPPPEIEVVQREVIIPRDTLVFSEESKPWVDALYDAQVHEFDYFMSRLQYRLMLHHLTKNTLIVITADHGEELLDHGYIGHGSTAVHAKLFDEVLRVPLILYCPRVVPEGLVIEAGAEQVDILPTVCDLLDIPIPPDAQGKSLVPAMRGETVPDTPVFAETIEGGYQAKESMKSTWYRSIRTPEWKLVTKTSPDGEEFQLYDLAADPGETKDVFDDERAEASNLLVRLTRWITANQEARLAIEMRGTETAGVNGSPSEVVVTEIPQITFPNEGDTLTFEDTGGSVTVRWSGNAAAEYVLEYHVGTGWHTLKGKLPVTGTSQVFGPLPRDGWGPIHQWNPFRLRVRPKNLPDGWSEWAIFSIAQL